MTATLTETSAAFVAEWRDWHGRHEAAREAGEKKPAETDAAARAATTGAAL